MVGIKERAKKGFSSFKKDLEAKAKQRAELRSIEKKARFEESKKQAARIGRVKAQRSARAKLSPGGGLTSAAKILGGAALSSKAAQSGRRKKGKKKSGKAKKATVTKSSSDFKIDFGF